jgi:hypothetical protein
MIAQAPDNSCSELLTSGAAQKEIVDRRLRVFFQSDQSCTASTAVACHD